MTTHTFVAAATITITDGAITSNPVLVPPLADGDRVIGLNGVTNLIDASALTTGHNLSVNLNSTVLTIRINDDNDTTTGANGFERTIGARFFQNATGGAGNDTLIGNSADNVLDGGEGNDSLDGGSGNDSLVGGAGENILIGGLDNDTLDNSAGTAGDARLDGGSGNDSLIGSAFGDTLIGGSGNDTITGGAIADTLTGGLGADTLTGGDGNDRYLYTNLRDSSLAYGIDTVNFLTGDIIDTPNLDITGTGTVTSVATLTALNATTLTGLFRSRGVGANQSVVFTVTGIDAGTYIGINDASTSFSSTSDAIIRVTTS